MDRRHRRNKFLENFPTFEKRLKKCRNIDKYDHINLSHLNLTEIPSLPSDETHSVVKLILSHNFILNPMALIGYHQLADLCLIDSGISTLENFSFNNLKLLKRLDISRNNISCLPEDVVELHQLQHLLVSNNFLSSVPNNFFRLKQLVQLDLSFNLFENISDELERLPLLTNLDISGNANLNINSLGIKAKRLYDTVIIILFAINTCILFLYDTVIIILFAINTFILSL